MLDIAGKPRALFVGGNVVGIKEFNLRRYFEKKHQDKNLSAS